MTYPPGPPFQPPPPPPGWMPSPTGSPVDLTPFLHGLQHQITQGFHTMGQQLWQVAGKVSGIEATLVEGRGAFERVDERQDRTEERTTAVEEDVTELKGRVARLERRKPPVPRWEKSAKRVVAWLMPLITAVLAVLGALSPDQIKAARDAATAAQEIMGTGK